MDISTLLMAGKYPMLTSMATIKYLAMFLPMVLIPYQILPQRAKKWWLLFMSWVYYWFISGTLIVYLLLSILSAHYFGLWLEHTASAQKAAVHAADKADRKAVKAVWQRRTSAIIALAVLLHIGAILYLKYTGFFASNINTLLAAMGSTTQIVIPPHAVPIGISFFTMTALSYIFDVKRGMIRADDNLGRLALFLSFFPEIVEGPIVRYADTARQLWDCGPLRVYSLKRGALRITYGVMKEMLIASRLNSAVKMIFDTPELFHGGYLFLGAAGYTLQLYADFSGTMDIICGIGQILGLAIPENFNQPFFSKTISEFWKRWHITLGTWFRDYIFYPVSMAKPMKKLTSHARKRLGNHFGPLIAGSIALFCVWICNGLWHGAGWQYIFFGMYHFFWILLGEIIAPAVVKVNHALHIRPQHPVYRGLQMVRTVILVIFGEMFFRAPSLTAGLSMAHRIFTDFSFTQPEAGILYTLGLDKFDFIAILLACLVILAVGIMREKKIQPADAVLALPVPARWALIYALILFIVMMGAYGKGYVPVDPMYADF